MRTLWRILCLSLAIAASTSPLRSADAAFTAWLQSLRADAEKLGVTPATFETLTRGLEPDLTLPDLVLPGRASPLSRGDQPEFVQTPADYLKESRLAALAAEGRRLRERHKAALAAIEQRFGVPGPVVLAIWGRETAFGSYKLPHDAIRVLATQAYVGRRKDKFREEFLLAMKMVQDGHVARAAMRSSWAGAMGLTQFLPSDFYRHAVDLDGDGRRDIWTSVPDALASAAKQLVEKGWQPGQPWAIEAEAPKDFDCTLAEPGVTRPLGEWRRGGFRPIGAEIGKPDEAQTASILQPQGTHGPSFLVLKNYFVIKEYNFSDLYVLFVGNLADRIGGGGSFATPWANVPQLKTADLEAMQKHLAAKGLYADKIDGKAGMKTRAALGAYQKAAGLLADCWPSAAVLRHLKRDGS